MVAAGVENDPSFFNDVVGIKGWFVWTLGKGIESGSGDAQVKGTKGNDKVEVFFENAFVFDKAFDEPAVTDDRLFDFLGGSLADAVIEKFEIDGDVFSLGTDKDLDGESEGVKEAGVGIHDGILFFFGEKVEVEGSGF